MGSVNLHIKIAGAISTTNTDIYESAYIAPQAGENISIDVAVDSSARRQILGVIDASGHAAYGTDINGTAWFVDRVRPGAAVTNGVAVNVNSVTVGVEPVNLPEMDGVWGIVTGGEDQTTIPGSKRLITLDIFVLARYAEYSDNDDLKNSLEVSVP